MDPFAPYSHQQCSLGIGPFPCRMIIFPNLHIACDATECEEPVEYAASVTPNSCC
jgi:hypothetical protein